MNIAPVVVILKVKADHGWEPLLHRQIHQQVYMTCRLIKRFNSGNHWLVLRTTEIYAHHLIQMNKSYYLMKLVFNVHEFLTGK
jgi:hypothetical protein